MLILCTGHMIQILCGSSGLPDCLDPKGKENMYAALFTRPQSAQSKATSFLLTNRLLTTLSPDMPSQEMLRDMDAGSVLARRCTRDSRSLHSWMSSLIINNLFLRLLEMFLMLYQ